MKRNFFKMACAALVVTMSSTSFVAYAKHTHAVEKRWVCETNASNAATGSSDAKADNAMKDEPKTATAAFAYAYKHCRDCTKISCSVQEKATTDNTKK
ncbi:MAG: hypothetical protein JO149_08095 [Gammaproteobacteria bacterium]|nr:hypothetical protein [Gammaproteobacteria bacterium]